jgi:hypothetical protein
MQITPISTWNRANFNHLLNSHSFTSLILRHRFCGIIVLPLSRLPPGPFSSRCRDLRGRIMYEQILPWVGLGVLLLLCLPIPSVQKVVLEVSAWVLRLCMIALLLAGVYLWFRPNDLPAQVSGVLSDFPRLLALLPAQGSQVFALCLACWIVVAFVPVLAMLDVTRALAGARLYRLRTLAATPVVPVVATSPTAPPVEAVLPTADEVVEPGVPIMRPVQRRTAADAMASAAPRHALRSSK